MRPASATRIVCFNIVFANEPSSCPDQCCFFKSCDETLQNAGDFRYQVKYTVATRRCLKLGGKTLSFRDCAKKVYNRAVDQN